MHLMSSLQTVQLSGLMALTPATTRFFLERTPDRAKCPDGCINGHMHQSFQAHWVPDALDSFKDQDTILSGARPMRRLLLLTFLLILGSIEF